MSSVRSRRKGGALASVALGVFLVIVLLVSAPIATAADFPKNVRGYIWDIEGNTEAGVDVVVNIRYAIDDTVRATLSDTTGGDGFYSVTFGPGDWDIGDRIQVISTWRGHQETNSTTATDAPLQWVNVTYPFEIPEFGSIVGFAIAGGLIGVVAAVFLVRRRR